MSVRTTGPLGTLRQDIEIDGVTMTAAEWLQESLKLRRQVLDNGAYAGVFRQRFDRVAEALLACGVTPPDLSTRPWWMKRKTRPMTEIMK